jgi:hypothetical protein
MKVRVHLYRGRDTNTTTLMDFKLREDAEVADIMYKIFSAWGIDLTRQSLYLDDSFGQALKDVPLLDLWERDDFIEVHLRRCFPVSERLAEVLQQRPNSTYASERLLAKLFICWSTQSRLSSS